MMEPLSFILLLVLTYFIAIPGGMAGGSYLLFIPTLLFFGIDIQQVIGITKITTLSCGLPFLNYMKHGKVNIKSATPLIILVAIGTIIGSLLVIKINKEILQTIVAVLMIAIAIFLFFDKNFGVKVKGKVKHWQKIVGLIIILIIGIYYGFFAAAASLFVSLTLVSFFKKDFIQGIGTARLMDFTAGIFGIIVFSSKGLINYTLAIPLGIVYFFGAWTGSIITLKKGSKFIKYVVAIIAIAFAIKLLFF